MRSDITLHDLGLPLFVITVRLAATILAYELGAWEGQDFTDAEIDFFLDENHQETIHTPGWQNLELFGNVKRARDSIEASICRSINAGRLKPRKSRRDLAGNLIAADTTIDIGDADEWAQEHGLSPDNWFDEYLTSEVELLSDVGSYLQDRREALRNGLTFKSVLARAAELDKQEVVTLLIENERLKKVHKVGEADRPLEPRQRQSMLRIIRALDILAKLPARAASTSVERQLRLLGFSKPGDAAIRSVIEQARALEPDGKPQ
jgi:hypothetical protein